MKKIPYEDKEKGSNIPGEDVVIFKHREVLGTEKFVTSYETDLLDMEDDDEVLRKLFHAFFSFLNEWGWPPEFILYHALEVASEEEERMNGDNEDDPLTKLDPEYRMFLQDLGKGDPEFLKELFRLYKANKQTN
jgi:hypothetical protein